MLIVSGRYRFKPKRVAFRNDFCLKCDQPRRSVEYRSFDAFHIFWIPIVPLGFRRRWLCATCGRPPHVNVKTRRPFVWIGLFILILLGALFWALPVDPDFVGGTWFFRMGGPVGAILVLVHLLRTPADPPLKSRLDAIPPANDTTCPFCGALLLLISSQGSCPNCGVLRC